MNGGNSVSSLPIQQQSKQRSHDMKRSLKATRFSDFAFYSDKLQRSYFFMETVRFYILSYFSRLPKIFFISFGNPFPM